MGCFLVKLCQKYLNNKQLPWKQNTINLVHFTISDSLKNIPDSLKNVKSLRVRVLEIRCGYQDLSMGRLT